MATPPADLIVRPIRDKEHVELRPAPLYSHAIRDISALSPRGPIVWHRDAIELNAAPAQPAEPVFSGVDCTCGHHPSRHGQGACNVKGCVCSAHWLP
jgi:hypothetical protein